MIDKMLSQFSRRKFLGAAGATTLLSSARGFGEYASSVNNSSSDGVPASSGKGRIVDMHVHFDPKKPNYIEDFLKVSERLNLTALMLTPFENRKVVAEAAKQHPTKIVPFGYVDRSGLFPCLRTSQRVRVGSAVSYRHSIESKI